MLDYNADHYCPVYKNVICADLCYDSLCCLNGEFKISSTKELAVNRRYRRGAKGL